MVKLRRRHPPLEVWAADQGGEQSVGVEQSLFEKPKIVNPNDARQTQRQISRIRIYFPDCMADYPVRIVVEIGTGSGQGGDDAALDEGNQAALVQPGGGHRSREGEEDGAVLLDRAPHQLESEPLLAPDVGAKGVREQLIGLLSPGDWPRIHAP